MLALALLFSFLLDLFSLTEGLDSTVASASATTVTAFTAVLDFTDFNAVLDPDFTALHTAPHTAPDLDVISAFRTLLGPHRNTLLELPTKALMSN